MSITKEIDVILCTYNSNESYFEKCIKSIKREIPLHHLIVVDKFSTDGTLDVIKKHFSNLIVKRTWVSLAEARKIGINSVDTEHFVFVDDDIELYANWFSTITQNMSSNVGAIHGTAYPIQMSKFDPYYKWMLWSAKRITKKIIDVDLKKLQKRIRGYTHNTIILTEAIKDWVPPKNIYGFEDWLIQKHIVKKGYIWRIIRDFTANHHAPTERSALREHFKRVRWNAANARITSFTAGAFQIFTDDVKQSIKAFKASIDYSDPRILLFVITLLLNYTAGYLQWNRYNKMQR